MCMWRIFPPGKYARIHFVGSSLLLTIEIKKNDRKKR